MTAGHRSPPKSSGGANKTFAPSSCLKHPCNINTSQSVSIEICDRKMSVESSFQLNTFRDTGSVTAHDRPEFFPFDRPFPLGYCLQYPCLHPHDDREPSRPSMESSPILASFPGFLLHRLLEFSLFCFNFPVESLNFQHPARDFFH